MRLVECGDVRNVASDKEGNPKQWDPADIGRIVNRYVFQSENPGIDAQRRA